jgi:ribosomal protein S18 acetylase RimI-like enzyme
MTGLTLECSHKGGKTPSSLLPTLADADRSISVIEDENSRTMLLERIEQIRQGAFEVFILSDHGKAIGFTAFQTTGKDANIRFGHVLPGRESECADLLSMTVAGLADLGIESVTSIFNWPGQEAFKRAAESIGFDCVERVNMIRRSDSGPIRHQLSEGIEILPWSSDHLEAAARILSENAFPADKAFHRPYRTVEGCLDYLNAVLNDRYGTFLPELSFVAFIHDRQVGQILAARLPRIGVNVVDLVVGGSFRGRGVASALFDRLFQANAVTAKENIVLTVTRSNQSAFRLYQELGFQITSVLGYYVYEIDTRTSDID